VVSPIFVPDVTVVVPPLGWQGRYADRVPAARRLLAGAQPAFHTDAQWTAPGVVAAPALSAPVYPDRVYGRPLVTRGTDVAAPILVADVTQVVTALSWRATYADRVWPPRALITAAQPTGTIDARIFIPVIPASPATGKHRVGIPRRQRTATVRGHQRRVDVPRSKRGEQA
jgi:hypothetical protein